MPLNREQQRQALFVLPGLQALLIGGSAEPVLLGLAQEKPLRISLYGYSNLMREQLPLRMNLIVASNGAEIPPH